MGCSMKAYQFALIVFFIYAARTDSEQTAKFMQFMMALLAAGSFIYEATT